MSDTKLREKADALIAFTLQGPRFIAWVEAVTDAIAPEPEKVAKVETMADRIAADLKAGTFRGEQPAPPAPEKAAKVECPNCGEMTERSHSRYEGPGPDKWACQPAPPEPAAIGSPEWDKRVHSSAAKIALTTAGMTTTPEPAAPEMPEILSAVMDHLYQAAEEFAHYDEGDRAERCNHLRAELKSWWRNLAQPLAGGMTEELEMVLSAAKNAASRDYTNGIPQSGDMLMDAIAAVRQQAAPGRKVELGKVRELIEWEVKNNGSGLWAAALAELDAAEGKERE